jgi:hypothetical protein
MRKLIGLMLLLGLFSLAAVAQENYSKAEVFGGYQYTRFDGGVNANGFNGALTGNLNHWFGVAADFSGAYKNVSGVDTKTYTYTFGPQIAMRRGGAFTPFAHALFGGFHSSASANGISASDSGFAFMLGGGADVKIAPALSVRLLQFDWLSLHSNGSSDNNNMRLSTGVVFHF